MTESITLIVVPHTHWDREWYETFQQFRVRLVHCVDHLLRALDADPAFTHFMLDGQMIVLDDYLEARPENADRLREYARSGRVQVGPWYVQPDEFLVGGEAIARNLLIGRRLAEPYGGAMSIGYVPDCFGHIAQLPQILTGFGIDDAVFWRGVGKDVRQSEFWWEAPDGSRVLALYLHGESGYSNARELPLNPDDLARRVERIVTPMLPLITSDAVLLMNGSDHLEPQDGLPAALAAANERLAARGWRLVIGTLPDYARHARAANATLATYQREWRSSELSHLLPGVLSTRVWIKQRNAAGEELLTRWADPFAAWAWVEGAPHPGGLLDIAWKLLLQNQPHDSICGCSIDQVHREMGPRYDQSAQIAEQVTNEALDAIAARVNTHALASDSDALARAGTVPVVVANPTVGPRDALVTCDVQLAAPLDALAVIDDAGRALAYDATAGGGRELMRQTVEREYIESLLGMVDNGRALGFRIVSVSFGVPDERGVVPVWASVSDHGEPDLGLTDAALSELLSFAWREDVTALDITVVESPRARVRFVARDLPPHGARSYIVRPRHAGDAQPPASDIAATPTTIENAYLHVAADPATGTLTVTDKITGTKYPGLLRLEDGGDVGDLYNYSPPPADLVVEHIAGPATIDLVEASAVSASLRVSSILSLPVSCAEDRQSRAAERVDCAIVTEVMLAAGGRRADLRVSVRNTARDHRLRALFPAPLVTEFADADGTFMVNRRPIHRDAPPGGWRDVIEDPIDTHPCKRFVSVSDGARGLTIASRGLAEYEVLPADERAGGVTVALTLLRCVEWLSRDDFATRRGHAGPPLHTPEAQMPGEWSFDLAVVPHAGTWRDGDALAQREALAFTAGVRARPTDLHEGPLPASFSFAAIEPAGCVLSAAKRAEDGDGMIVRWYNPLNTAVLAELSTIHPFERASLVTMSEAHLSDLAGDPDAPARRWRVPTGAGAIVTVRLRA